MAKKLRSRIILVIGLGILVAVIVAGYFPKGYFLSGFGGTHKHKTLWDWLNLAGVVAVPLVLAWLGFRLQLQQQQQNDLQKQRELEQKQRELEQTKAQFEEEALQHYLDRVSNLVLEKNLLAIATKVEFGTEEAELLDASAAVIRILTLSTLRRLSDGVRKASVVRILIDTNILGLRVGLEGADLRGAFLVNAYLAGVILKSADLRGAHLEGARLEGANLSNANLSNAKLRNATLRGATLRGATLRGTILSVANLTDANLTDADLSYANLTDTDLSYTNLSLNTINKRLTKEQLENTYLCNTKLPEGIDMDPNRDCSKPYDEWLSEKMKARIKEREAQPLQE